MRNLAHFIRDVISSGEQSYVLVRFVAVGASFSLLYSALASVLALIAGVAPAPASAIAYLTCIPPAYLAQRNLAFRAAVPHARAFPRYVMLQAPLLGIGALLSWLTITVWGWAEAPAFFVIGPVVAGVSFLAQKLWTFAQK